MLPIGIGNRLWIYVKSSSHVEKTAFASLLTIINPWAFLLCDYACKVSHFSCYYQISTPLFLWNDTFKKDIRQKTKINRMCPKGTSYLLFIIKVFYNLIKWFYHFYSQSESVDNTIEYSNTGNDDPVLNFWNVRLYEWKWFSLLAEFSHSLFECLQILIVEPT